MNGICLVLDRLHAGYLGAYGNGWVETPELDRFASQSFLFDQALVDSPRLDSLVRSYWQGWHTMLGDPPSDRPTLIEPLRAHGIRTILLTDESQVAGHPLAQQFDELLWIDLPLTIAPARTIHQTHLARCFTQLIDVLQSAVEPFFLWVHFTALGAIWDAPPQLREQYVEEDDPEPLESAAVPGRMLPKNYDPDDLLGVSQAYAAQVTVLDACLGALFEAMEDRGLRASTLLTLLGARGFPLGEQGRIGPCDDGLVGSLVQVPWMMRWPDGLGAGVRSQALIQPADLWATLGDFFQLTELPASPSGRSLLPVVVDESRSLRDRVCISGPVSEQAIRTPAWYLRSVSPPQLYAKPDDRWEVNDVANRCAEITELLQAALDDYRQALRQGRAGDLPPLDEALR
jgi:arylsulfatase A-like enzyme